MEQTFFNYGFKPKMDNDNFFVGDSNLNAYNFLIKYNNNKKIYLIGPMKSGKTHLALIWQNKYDAILYKNNFDEVINLKKNILIDNLFSNLIEENIFHIINHCNLNKLKILITSNTPLNKKKINLNDLSSRLKTFHNISIDLPDDQLLINLMIKLFHDRQIIVKNPEIFNYIIKRVHRSYEKVFNLIVDIDKLLFKKNKQLTIPLIKELI